MTVHVISKASCQQWATSNQVWGKSKVIDGVQTAGRGGTPNPRVVQGWTVRAKILNKMNKILAHEECGESKVVKVPPSNDKLVLRNVNMVSTVTAVWQAWQLLKQ